MSQSQGGLILRMQGYFNITNHHTNRMMEKNTSSQLMPKKKKIVYKSQYPFLIKTLNKIGTEGNLLNMIKAIYEKPTAKLIKWLKC